MAKCVGSLTSWTIDIVDLDDLTFIADDVKVGESSLNTKLEALEDLVLDVGNDFALIKPNYFCDDNKWDGNQVQDSVFRKLKLLSSEAISVVDRINTSSLPISTKQRYYTLYSYGVVNKLERLLMVVGRLSELDQRIYSDEGCKPLKSEESITIHTLATIWMAVIETMTRIREPACDIFKELNISQDLNDAVFEDYSCPKVDQKYFEIFMFDLVITSWIHFNRLVKFDDLRSGLPMLCPCHCKIFCSMLRKISEERSEFELLTQLLSIILDYKSVHSKLTTSLDKYDLVPLEPCYKDSDRTHLAYFVVWHLYSLSRIVNEELLKHLSSCRSILEDSFKISMNQFVPEGQQSKVRLSHHQEERFKLMFTMINSWCENTSHPIKLTKLMFQFLDDNWNLFGSNYFDQDKFRIEGLTMFELFTKLLGETTSSFFNDRRSAPVTNKAPTPEEEELIVIWDRLTSKAEPKKTAST